MPDPLGIIGPLYDTSIAPERIEELIRDWEDRIGDDMTADTARVALLGAPAIFPHVERALEIMERLHGGDQMFLSDALAAIRLAAFVLTPQGVVVQTNLTAQACFDLFPGDSIRRRLSGNTQFAEIARCIDERLSDRGLTEDVFPLRFDPAGRMRLVSITQTRPPSGARQFLVCTSDFVWPDMLDHKLETRFGLTAAEIGILRQLFDGETVSGIATATRRKESTVRSQVHSLMSKTRTRSQAELLRLVHVLLAALPSAEVRSDPERAFESAAERKSAIRLPDGRRMDVFAYGRPKGTPVIWLQSTLGLFRPTREQEDRMRALGLRVLVPIRAGFGGSDPLPVGAEALDLAVDDTLSLMDFSSIGRASVVAPSDDIRLALMLAHKVPDRVAQIVALGPCFPIFNDIQYRRMHRTGRFFRSCARNAPAVLPFLAGAFRAMVMRSGIEAFAQRAFAGSAGDSRLLADREVAEAFIGGFTYLFGAGTRPETAFCAELEALHSDWPPGLGNVACPVTVFHGGEDGNAPLETLRDYAALYPAWQIHVIPDVGQLVYHAAWERVLSSLAA
jgi:pimeloyl-ACP methyl ester carboxylesterase/DNA-binding CsgD family transcriptional regulator/PAS domain-containing protein